MELMSEPLGAYNLLWRTTKIWPNKVKTLMAHYKTLKTSYKKKTKLLKLFPEQLLLKFPVMDMRELVAGTKGILSIQHYYNITCDKIAEGFGVTSNRIQVEQVVEFGDIAVKNNYYKQAVEWYQLAVKRLEQVSGDAQLKSRVARNVEDAKERHDGHLMTEGLVQYDPKTKNIFYTNTRPYDTDLADTSLYIALKHDYDKLVMTATRDRDLARDNLHPWRFWSSIYVGLDPMRKSLCQGKIPNSHVLKCSLLTHDDPYLLLAPFKYEEVKAEPWVGIILDLAYPGEIQMVKDEARGNLVTTTLVDFNNEGADDTYTNRRTSKVTYRSEKSMPSPLAKWTKRIELSTQLDLTSSRMSSENYQIMNYGLGGAILTHRDSTGTDTDLNDPVYSESWNNGGPRMATVMIWISEVDEGGRTVFSGSQVGVKGRLGAGLVWWNIRSDGSLDSRNHHTGCPVVRGNKWIANKWVKWPSQMARYPCSRTKGEHYNFIH